MITAFASIAVLLINFTAARAAPVHGIDASAFAEASLVEKSVNINRTPPLQLLVAARLADMRMTRMK